MMVMVGVNFVVINCFVVNYFFDCYLVWCVCWFCYLLLVVFYKIWCNVVEGICDVFVMMEGNVFLVNFDFNYCLVDFY